VKQIIAAPINCGNTILHAQNDTAYVVVNPFCKLARAAVLASCSCANF